LELRNSTEEGIERPILSGHKRGVYELQETNA
jgi:hypothetical protein